MSPVTKREPRAPYQRVELGYVPTDRLDPILRDELWQLGFTHGGPSQDEFSLELARAHEVFAAIDAVSSAVVGYGTHQIVNVGYKSIHVAVLVTRWRFPDYQGPVEPLLERAGLHAFLAYRRQHPLRKMSWLVTPAGGTELAKAFRRSTLGSELSERDDEVMTQIVARTGELDLSDVLYAPLTVDNWVAIGRSAMRQVVGRAIRRARR